MKTKTFYTISALFITFMVVTTTVFCHVVDVEFTNLADRYALDPDKGDRDFYDWVNYQSRKDDDRDHWVRDLVDDVAFEVAASFDPRLGDRD